jgi:uncharacterized membrane protein
VTQTQSFLSRRWRVLLAAGLGVAGFILVRLVGVRPGLAVLIGWNIAAAAFLIATWRTIWRESAAEVRARAAVEDESRVVILGIVLSTVAAGFAATVVAMHEAKAAGAHQAGADPRAWLFSVSTLILGWLVVQTVFALHYAHLYFGGGEDGIEFPGERPATYYDFVYMAACVGVSGQVSDFNITTHRMRRVVTVHALLAFFFNTAVLALGINILATLIGQ